MKTKLSKAELKELAGLYVEYYEFDQVSTYSLGRMRALEGKATDEQLTKLLAKHGKELEEEFA